jgi:N-ethylmaleimide reductase
MKTSKLLEPYLLGTIELKNRIVMSPMTRSRAIGNIPNELMATYYSQRANAGLIITEGTSPSPRGLGYGRIPGIFNQAQVEGWQKITQAVHAQAGRIFVQLMHTGRIGHSLNLPQGAVVLAPSAVRPAGQVWTDQRGLQDYPVPQEMTLPEIEATKKEFATAAANAAAAGFDGVELHGANGYLLEQFLSPISNRRTDAYGGNVENRSRFVLEVAEAVIQAIGAKSTGIRLSPYGVASDMQPYPEIDATYQYLAKQLSRLGLLYLHVVDHSSMGAPEVPFRIKQEMRAQFQGTLILAGGYTSERAEADLRGGQADLIAFGRPYINNPDLALRFKNNLPLAINLDSTTFYTPGEKGYTDYPAYMLEIPVVSA